MANDDLVNVLNPERGTVGKISRRLFEHPVFNPGTLVEVEEGTKPYAPELYKPKDAATFLQEKASRTNPQTDEAQPQVATKTKDAD